MLMAEFWPREVPSSCRTIAGYRYDCQYLALSAVKGSPCAAYVVFNVLLGD
ncbi:hypothetical protein ACLK17_18960 [Escherichia coli]